MTRLRVAVIVGDTRVPAWVTALIERLGPPAFDVQLYVDSMEHRHASPWAYRAYEWLDRRVFADARDALAPVALGGALQPLEALDDADVAVHLGYADASAVAGATRYGAWTLSHVEEEQCRNTPALFWEMYEGCAYETTVAAHLPGGGCRVVYSSRGAPDRASLHRSRNHAYWKASAAIARALHYLQQRGRTYLDSRPQQDEAASSTEGGPRVPTVLRHAGAVWAGVLARRLRKVAWREEWFVAARPVGADGFRDFEAAPGEHLADPFAVEYDGETYVFVERIDRHRGRAAIAYIRLDGSARPLGPPITVLAPEYHVSYPFVFRRDRDVYMIPESLENETVDLYRASDFPSRWVHEARLLSGIRAVDATLFDDGSRLWLFVNVAEPGASINDELHLFTAPELRGPWVSHPENPIISDVGRARPAGRIFRHDGELIRPSQDCFSAYGRAVVLNRIDVLTATDYRETPIGRIEPDWAPRLHGTHTYNSTGRFEVRDGFRFALRYR